MSRNIRSAVPPSVRKAPAIFAAFALLAFAAGDAKAQQQQQAAQPPQAGQPQGQSAAIAPDAAYALGSGDRLRITVFGQPELTGEYHIDGANTLSFPLIGRLQAGGMTAPKLEQLIAQRLNQGFLKEANVSVEVLSYRPFYILGEVKTPGAYPYISGMSVLNAVALAGGFTYRAKESSFYVMRNGQNGGKSKMDASQETPILPGDIIQVRERWF